MLNVYKIPAKEYQVVDHSEADEISVSKILFWIYLEYVPLILRNYKKLNRMKVVRFKISSFPNAQYFLGTAGQQFSSKGRSFPVI